MRETGEVTIAELPEDGKLLDGRILDEPATTNRLDGSLEGQTRGKLCCSSRSRACEHTEIGRPIRESRDVEVRVIQQIVEFAAQIEL